MVQCVSILGSTGSIGRQTLDIIDNLKIPVAALTAGTNVERMAQQCREFLPELAVMATQEAAEQLAEQIRAVFAMEEKKKDFSDFVRDVVSKILGYGLAIILASIVLASFPSCSSYSSDCQWIRRRMAA